MALRPGRCYRTPKRPYTRVSIRNPRKSYVKGVPGPKIVKFEVGDPNKEFPLTFYLLSKDRVQIRHNALEAARTNASKYLAKMLGKDGYFLKILVYPHQVMRENPIATGAGADRLQEGMRRSFGKPIGLAARVKEGQRLIMVRVPEGKESIAKEALRRASHKFPCSCQIVSENN
ncbi:MAG TPA: 50S ribosomal protein L16 [Candidatus Aenigmarchaeota archaeon]|nr:50S ribosomal protein L16 [Candidatus Aenigmarchaeota archaeon]